MVRVLLAPRLDKLLGRRRKEEALLEYVLKSAAANDPRAVLHAMDEFATHQRWMMNIGPRKGAVLTEALSEVKARRVLEIGAYCGYSAALIASQLPEDGGSLVSVEKNPRYAAITQRIVEHAGLQPRHQVLTGMLAQHLSSLDAPFDLVLLDHWKDDYLPDLKRLENHGLLRAGTHVVADNVGLFNVADYLHYVRTNPRYISRFHESTVEYNERIRDGVEVSIFCG